MTSVALSLARPASTSRDRPAAKACGRRLHHTRRYVASLIALARATDAQAISRLRQRAIQGDHHGVLGLTVLADTLILPTTGQTSPLRYPAR
jgi:hypothetical protein